MAFTQEQLDALNSAIADGVTSVAYRDRTVTYRDLNEMLRIKGMMEAQLVSGANSSSERVQRVSTDRGYQ